MSYKFEYKIRKIDHECYEFVISKQDSNIKPVNLVEAIIFTASNGWKIRKRVQIQIAPYSKNIWLIGSNTSSHSCQFFSCSYEIDNIKQALAEFKEKFCKNDSQLDHNHKLTHIFV